MSLGLYSLQTLTSWDKDTMWHKIIPEFDLSPWIWLLIWSLNSVYDSTSISTLSAVKLVLYDLLLSIMIYYLTNLSRLNNDFSGCFSLYLVFCQPEGPIKLFCRFFSVMWLCFHCSSSPEYLEMVFLVVTPNVKTRHTHTHTHSLTSITHQYYRTVMYRHYY